MVAMAAGISPLLLGSVHFWVAAIWFVWLLVACFLVLHEQKSSKYKVPRLSLFSIAFGLGAIWSFVQIIPLPIGLISLFSPLSHEWYAAGVSAAGLEMSGFRTFSMAPAESADRGLRFGVLALASIAVVNLRDRSALWRVLVGALVFAALGSLITGYVHRAMGLQEFFGFYLAKRAPQMSSFVSSNHASSLFGGAALVCSALSARMARTQNRGAAMALGGAGIGMFIAMMEAESAGALLAFLVSALLFMALFLGHMLIKRRWLVFSISGGVVGLGIALPFLMNAISGGRWIFDSLETRVELMSAAVRASVDFWLVGSGSGSTQYVVPAYTDWTLLQDHSIPTIENELVEWVLTMGWPVAAIMLGLLALTLLMPNIEGEVSERRHFFISLNVALSAYFLAIGAMHFPFIALGLSLPMLIAVEAMARQVYQAHKEEAFAPGAYPYVKVENFAPKILIVLSVLAIGFVGGRVVYSLPELNENRQEERRVRLTPGDSRLYFSLAQDARKRGDSKAALELAKRAAHTEPTARMRLYLAWVMAEAEEIEESKKLYVELLENPWARTRAASAASSLFGAAELAQMVVKYPEIWRHTYLAVNKRKGKRFGADFALELATLAPKSAEASVLVIQSYSELKEWEVAEVWARSMVASRLRDEEGNAPGFGIWVDVLVKAGKRDEALRVAREAQKEVPGDPRIAQVLMQMRTPKATEAPANEVARVRAAHQVYCTSDRAGQARVLCLSVEAWLAESEGSVDNAEKALRDLADRFNNPVPLAELLHRHARCVALRSLHHQWKERSPSPRLGQLAESCR